MVQIRHLEKYSTLQEQHSTAAVIARAIEENFHPLHGI